LTGALTARTDRPAVAGTLTVRAGDLSPWSALAGTALAGSADARIVLTEKDGQRIDMDGTLRNLRMADLQAQAESVRIEAHLGDVLAKPTGRAQLEASNITLPDLRFDRLRFNGRSAAPDVFALSLDTNGVLRPATHAQPLRLSAHGEASLAPQRQLRLTRLTGKAGAHDIASRAPLTATATPGGFRIEGLDLGIGDGRVVGSASREAARIAMQLQIRNLPLSIVQLAAPDPDVTGRVDGTMRLAGTAAQPDGQVELSFRDVRIATAGDLPPLSATALGTWKSERFDVVGQIATPDGTKLDLRGALPVRLDADTLIPAVIPDGALRASAKGDGRLERWAALLPLGEDRISGQYTIDLSVDGTPANPTPQGRLAISNGHYVNFAAGTEISDIAAEVAGNGTHFVLTRLSGKDGANGTLTGSGSVDFAAGAALDLRARFTGFGFMRRDDLTASGDGELHLAGTVPAMTLSGRLRVDRAEIRIPERLPPSIAFLPVVEVNSKTGEVLTAPEKPAASSPIALAVDVEIPARMFVRGRGLESEWRGNVQVGGSTAAPQLTGRLQTVRGDFSLLGKRFVLSDSTITFTGEEKIDPQLSITAEHRTAAIAAQAVITGTASAPSIRLTSQPELPQDEVLARVLFGRSVTQISPAQGLELAQAAATLAGRGGPGVIERVRTATGLDRLDISSRQPSAAGEASGTAVTAGRYVTDRVFVGVEQGFRADSTRPKVEVEITPNLSVESSVGDSSAGVGVNWKWDY
jgi:translocation and assembly module TamB